MFGQIKRRRRGPGLVLQRKSKFADTAATALITAAATGHLFIYKLSSGVDAQTGEGEGG